MLEGSVESGRLCLGRRGTTTEEDTPVVPHPQLPS